MERKRRSKSGKLKAQPRDATPPLRTCAVTRRQAPPEALIRFVRAPDGSVAPDLRARLPGRGVWVTARAPLVAEAARKQVFARQFKAEAAASPRLAEEVDRLLEADCLQSLSIAAKAGCVVTGFGKVWAALEKGTVRALVEASDGAWDGKRKLASKAQGGASGAGPGAKSKVEVVALFTSRQLDLALGRTNVIHAALAAGGPAEAFLGRCRRLADYRGESLSGEPVPAQTGEGEAEPDETPRYYEERELRGSRAE